MTGTANSQSLPVGSVERATRARLEKVFKLARMMDERGYGIWVRLDNISDEFGVAFYGFTKKHIPTNAVIIIVEYITLIEKLSFNCRIPARVAYRPIHAALELTLKNSLNILYRSGDTIYFGNTRTALEVFIKILEMPQHREILLAPRKKDTSQ
jgi:hypothetical protein